MFTLATEVIGAEKSTCFLRFMVSRGGRSTQTIKNTTTTEEVLLANIKS